MRRNLESAFEVLNHRYKRSKFSHFHIHVIPRYDISDKRDSANVKPSQTWPREPDSGLNKVLSKLGVCETQTRLICAKTGAVNSFFSLWGKLPSAGLTSNDNTRSWNQKRRGKRLNKEKGEVLVFGTGSVRG